MNLLKLLIMIEKGMHCNIYPDKTVVYEIVNVHEKKIQVTPQLTIMKEFVDLENVNNRNEQLKNISIDRLSIIN